MTLLKLFEKLGWSIEAPKLDVMILSDNPEYRGIYMEFDWDSDIQLLSEEISDWSIKTCLIYGRFVDRLFHGLVVEL